MFNSARHSYTHVLQRPHQAEDHRHLQKFHSSRRFMPLHEDRAKEIRKESQKPNNVRVMREILYRAISLCRGEHWVYGQPRHYASNPHTEKWTIYDPATGIETDICEETICQYTGLHDIKCNPIYEGDILRVTSLQYDTLGKKMNVAVEYNTGMAQFIVKNGEKRKALGLCALTNDVVVIGNLHDNTELLKGGEK